MGSICTERLLKATQHLFVGGTQETISVTTKNNTPADPSFDCVLPSKRIPLVSSMSGGQKFHSRVPKTKAARASQASRLCHSFAPSGDTGLQPPRWRVCMLLPQGIYPHSMLWSYSKPGTLKSIETTLVAVRRPAGQERRNKARRATWWCLGSYHSC